MPLSKTAQSVLADMVERYGKKKGPSVFYGKVMKDKKFAKAMGEMAKHMGK